VQAAERAKLEGEAEERRQHEAVEAEARRKQVGRGRRHPPPPLPSFSLRLPTATPLRNGRPAPPPSPLDPFPPRACLPSQDEEEQLARSLASKQAALPPEPSPSEPDYAATFTIMVRLPDGSRKGRRFRPTDSVASVFDYVDVQSQGGGLVPHSYRLVCQFPRRVFAEGAEGSLGDSGISGDQAMLVELL
jgi:hypothetical protein